MSIGLVWSGGPQCKTWHSPQSSRFSMKTNAEIVNICRKHHNLCLPRTYNETLHSSGKFPDWFPSPCLSCPPCLSCLGNSNISSRDVRERRLMINGGGGAQNNWQPRPGQARLLVRIITSLWFVVSDLTPAAMSNHLCSEGERNFLSPLWWNKNK